MAVAAADAHGSTGHFLSKRQLSHGQLIANATGGVFGILFIIAFVAFAVHQVRSHRRARAEPQGDAENGTALHDKNTAPNSDTRSWATYEEPGRALSRETDAGTARTSEPGTHREPELAPSSPLRGGHVSQRGRCRDTKDLRSAIPSPKGRQTPIHDLRCTIPSPKGKQTPIHSAGEDVIPTEMAPDPQASHAANAPSFPSSDVAAGQTDHVPLSPLSSVELTTPTRQGQFVLSKGNDAVDKPSELNPSYFPSTTAPPLTATEVSTSHDEPVLGEQKNP